jgi:hypothetical protein
MIEIAEAEKLEKEHGPENNWLVSGKNGADGGRSFRQSH